jgi:UDP-GlcNAc:undecaprenyl-phosphate GlcNAc-1-phosphate transferase
MFFTPLIRKFSLKFKLGIDHRNDRKTHQKRIITRLGGVSIFISIFISLLLTYFFILDNRIFLKNISGILLGSLLILFTGLYDDIKGIKALNKLLLQIFASLILIKFNIIANFSKYITSDYIHYINILITIMWIVGITNAINLIDGLDGLAAGIISIASITIFLISVINKNIPTAFLSIILGGATIGFLRYNFNPAKLFLGDSGSMLLGFFLASTAVIGSQKSATVAAILIPITALGLPIADTFFAIIRRTLKGINIFRADNGHIHHLLVSWGLTHRQAVLFLYALTIILGSLAFLITAIRNEISGMILFVMGAIVFVGIKKIGFIDHLQILKNNINGYKKNNKNIFIL